MTRRNTFSAFAAFSALAVGLVALGAVGPAVASGSPLAGRQAPSGQAQSGQSQSGQDQTQQGAPLVNPSYVLGPEDILTIITQNVPECSGDFMVAPNGHIMFPIVGDVDVQGKTLDQLQKILITGLTTQLRDPQVSVNLKQMRQNRIYILGSVRAPSVYDYKHGWKLSNLIAEAGGITDTPNRLTAVLFRTGQDPEKIDLSRLFVNADPAADIALQTGDTVYIQPIATIQITVVGEVNKSGTMMVDQNEGAVQALGAAGGPTNEALLTKAVIRRGNADIPVNLYDAVIKGEVSKDVTLKDGDTLIIPKQQAQVSVVGTVTHPGPLFMPDGRTLTLTQAISMAGGLAQKAKQAGTLTRVGKDGKLETIKFNLRDLGSPKHPDFTLQDKDVVFIPQSGAVGLGDLINISQFYWVVRAFGF